MKKIFFILALVLVACQTNVNAQLLAHWSFIGPLGGIDLAGGNGSVMFPYNPSNPQPVDTTFPNGACLNGISLANSGGQLLITPYIAGLDTNDFEFSFDFILNSFNFASHIICMGGSASPFKLYVLANGQVGLYYFLSGTNYTSDILSQTFINTGQLYSGEIKHYGNLTQVLINGSVCLTLNSAPLIFSDNGIPLTNFLCNLSPGGFNGCISNLRIYNNTVIITAPPANINVTTSGNCGSNVTYSAGTAVGDPNITWSYAPPSGTFFSNGTHTVTATASNGTASESTTFTVTQTNSTLPEFTYCPPSITLNPLTGSCNSGLVSLTPATATDCGNIPLTVTNNAPPVFPLGLTVVTWSATGVSGTSTCTQNVTVQDNIAPTVICPANITATAATGECSKTVTFPNPTITDCCILPTGSIPGYPGMVYIGTFQNHSYYINTTSNASVANAQATGAGGYLVAINSAAENNFLTSVLTNTNSYWMGGYQNLSNPNYAEPAGGWEWLTGEPFTYTNWEIGEPNDQSSENNLQFLGGLGTWYDVNYNALAQSIVEFECTSPAVVTTGNPSGSIFPVGISTVTWQATDRSGNTGSCSFTVTVKETEPPVITCPANITVNAPAGSCQALVNYAIPLVTDNCSPPPTSVVGLNYLGSYGGHTYFKLGNTNTWSAANAAAINFGGSLVSINDAGENAFLQSVLSFGTFWTGGFQNHQSGSYAEPSGGWEWLDGSNFSSFTNWASGQPDNSFNLEDNLIFNASAGTWFDNYTNNTFVQAIVEFSSSIVPVLVSGQPSGSVFSAGTHTITYSATDFSGNSDTCSFTVTVNATTVNAQMIVASKISCNGECDGSLRVVPSGGTAPFTYLWSNGSTKRKIQNLCKNTYTITVNDAGGCSVVKSKLLNQPTPLKISHVKTEISSHNANDGAIIFTVNGGTTPYTYLWNDGYTSGTRTNISTGLYSITITDAHGCSKTVLKRWTNPPIATRNQSNADENFISLYPNPANGLVNLIFDNTQFEYYDVKIFNGFGEKVLDEKGNAQQLQFDLSAYKKGLYLFEIKIGDKQKVMKIMLQ